MARTRPRRAPDQIATTQTDQTVPLSDTAEINGSEPATSDSHPTDASRSGPFGALASKAFGRYWPALALSLTGVWVRITVIGYLVYELTDDEFKLGLIGFAQAAPVLVAAPIAG